MSHTGYLFVGMTYHKDIIQSFQQQFFQFFIFLPDSFGNDQKEAYNDIFLTSMRLYLLNGTQFRFAIIAKATDEDEMFFSLII